MCTAGRTVSLFGYARRTVVVLVLLSSTWLSASQVPATASISGIVIDADARRPVAGASLKIFSRAGLVSKSAVSGPQGTFDFPGLPAGAYTIQVSATGYLEGGYGRSQTSILDSALVLRAEQRVTGVTLRLSRAASISGRVLDEVGDSLVGVGVSAYRKEVRPSGPVFVKAGTAVTDDTGQYRFGGLAPSPYFVGVSSVRSTAPSDVASRMESRGGWRTGTLALFQSNNVPIRGPAASVETYPTTFYGGSPSLQLSTPVVVSSGEDRRAVDIALRPVKASSLRGTIRGAGVGYPIPLRLVPVVPDDYGTEDEMLAAFTVSNTDGHFEFTGVVPGSYTLRAMFLMPRSDDSRFLADLAIGTILSNAGVYKPSENLRAIPPSPRRELWGALSIQVGESPADVELMMKTAPRVSGRLQFQGATQPVAATNLYVGLEPASGRVGETIRWGALRDKGASMEFTTYGAPAGRYLIRLHGEVPGWQVASAMQGGLDRLDTPFELGDGDVPDVVITMTRERREISGVVRNADNVPDPEAAVLLFPSDRAAWRDFGITSRRFLSGRVASDGTYSLAAPPPGNYLVVALPAEQAGVDWREPGLLARLAATATSLRIDTGRAFTLDLRTRISR
jgi:hypothetical protein